MAIKKIILSIVLFIASFAVAYLIICYLPNMRIKLAAEPMEYFVESIKSNMGLKALVSTVVGLFFVGLFCTHKKAK
ncbi:MAG: hypothetical protein RR177_02940 [Oscillospiraceae bacterium]